MALEIRHREEIEGLLAGVRTGAGRFCLSEYTFANLYLFRGVHDYRYLPGEHPCICGRTYDGVRHLIPLFDLAGVPATRLAELLAGHECECFFPVSGKNLSGLDQGVFRWQSMDPDSDYVYPVENFSCRSGPLRDKAAAVAALAAAGPVEVAAGTGPGGECFEVLERWMLDKGKRAGEADETACREALLLSEALRLQTCTYYSDGRPVGFLIAESLGPEVSVIRFAKGLASRGGIYPYMFRDYCTSNPAVRWLNFEQDLGIANLRRSKRSYRPEMQLEKFRVFLRAS